MSNKDYEIALLLQKQFEEEQKSRGPKENPGDLQMARLLHQEYERERVMETSRVYGFASNDESVAKLLQLEFEREATVDTPANNLYYVDKKNKNKDSTKSLVDPSWELADPTPNIHNLFIAFDQRFFWNKLQMVTVSWSKRMTSCAGICSYQGRGGLCSITLSEPLLKLRPRKDLVETLLHEMIHALLFVTHNNKDRDGHGPEFHKHMYRINSEAGTNITVYHNFHDEVNLYKQHWWRCTGPCQKWKPYFGIVRRATNRAPGPNDFWWGEHSRNCGGEFIKVKEPEKPDKKSASKKSQVKSVVSGTSTSILPFLKKENTKSNIIGFKDLDKKNNANNSKSIGNKSSNIKTTGNVTSFTPAKKGNTAVRSNSTNTVVINSTSKYNNNKNNSKTNTKTDTKSSVIKTLNDKSNHSESNATHKPIEAFAGQGRSLSNSGSSVASTSQDYELVRNHWLNKFSDSGKIKSQGNSLHKKGHTSSKNIPKRENTNTFSDLPNKKLKLSDNAMRELVENDKTKEIEVIEIFDEDDLTTCPICGKKILHGKINAHLDQCLNNCNESDSENLEECVSCGKFVKTSDRDNHLSQCLSESFEGDDVFFNEIEVIKKNAEEKAPINDLDDLSKRKCSVCEKLFQSDALPAHVESCLTKFYDDIDKEHNLTPKKESLSVSCLVCNQSVLKSELNSHLDDCMFSVFDSKYDFKVDDLNENPEEKSSKSSLSSEPDNKFNCPICMTLVLESQMNKHLDVCASN